MDDGFILFKQIYKISKQEKKNILTKKAIHQVTLVAYKGKQNA